MNTTEHPSSQTLGPENRSLVAALIGGRPETWEINEIGDGNVNLIFRLQGPKGCVLVKQAVPYLRCVGESWPLSLKRNYFEYVAFKEHSVLVPDLMPQVFGFEVQSAAMVMEYLGEHTILRTAMMRAERFPVFAEHISEYMAKTLFFTSDLALSAAEKKAKMRVFCENTDLCKITEDLIFTDPYRSTEQNRWTSPHLDSLVKEIQGDRALKIAVIEMKAKFLTCAEALIHGDLHSGSIMVNARETKIIDPEFAFYGPMGFDLGLLIGNFLMSYFSQSGWEQTANERAGYEEWILHQICEIWNLFTNKFTKLWDTNLTGDYISPNLLKETQSRELVPIVRLQYMSLLFTDSMRFAATEMIRRILGLAHVADLDTITDPNRRALCETRALNMARELLVHHQNYVNITDVVALARTVRHVGN